MMEDLLASDTLRRRGWCNVPYVQRLMREHVSGFADHSTQLWGLMSIEMWTRKFIDSHDRSGLRSTTEPGSVPPYRISSAN